MSVLFRSVVKKWISLSLKDGEFTRLDNHMFSAILFCCCFFDRSPL